MTIRARPDTRATAEGARVAGCRRGGCCVATGADDLTKSAWFVGYTQDQSSAITLFRNKPGQAPLLPLKDVGGTGSLHGNVFPPRIWARFMGYDGDFALNRR
ncbi:hypothetical protein R6V09_43770 [Streptomyces sp. W16]|uniref:hypothetical protein n=1 Tax=Streptomyces sp. W16 TaxID=3076631 RepID=UPI00295B4428|nr:hypothetical protein [Streptomyces sp. W16]MDV9177033.1 hypothetical protein [Streptomyces sp. W16]